MKLFRKIFLQTILGFLLISQLTMVYFLYESQKQTLMDQRKSQEIIFTDKFHEFSRKLEESLKLLKNNDAEGRKLAAVQSFRDVFGNYGAFYQHGEWICNATPYEFDYMGISEVNGENNGEVPIQTIDGRKLMLTFTQISDSNIQAGILYYQDVTEIYQRTERLFLKGFLITVFLLVVGGFIIWKSLFATMRPLMELKKAAAAISEGKYQIRVSEGRKDELGELACSFNHMAATIEESIQKLTETNRRQQQMLGSLAHELKTPMTAIMGYADTLLTVRLSDKRREQALRYIQKECSRLSRLSVKILELTGLYEEEKSGLNLQSFQVGKFLNHIKALTGFTLKEKEIQLEVQCSPSDLQKTADVDLLTSFVLNLVDNAGKASEEGGKIRIIAEDKALIVEDYGRGITSEDLERVTEAFYMVDKSRSRKEGGAGLGLALCKEIADLHHWKMSIESEPEKGTRVILSWLQSGYKMEDIR
nr:HAMP domain-containing sensor histidine kinase [uncultured Blautia sp.]